MEKRQFKVLMLAIGLVLLHGCNGGGSVESMTASPSEPLNNALPGDGSADADAGLIASEVIPGAVAESVKEELAEQAEVGNENEAVINADAESDTDALAGEYSAPVDSAREDSAREANASQDSASGTSALVKKDTAEPETLWVQVPVVEAGEPIHATQHLTQEAADSEDASETLQTTPADDAANQSASDQDNTDNLQSEYADSVGIDTITDLVFLTGQSNAASLVTQYDAELDAPDSRVFAFTDQGWRVADLHQFWDEGIPGNFSANDPARDPYNNIIFQVGKALALHADRTVGIVMLTAPGEGISHWDYGDEFYSRMQEHAIAALNALPHKSSFDALVWMQGETDWLLQGTADPDLKGTFTSFQSDAYIHYYPRKLAELIASLRSDPWFGDQARFICTETIKAKLNPHLMWLNHDDDALTGCAAASDLAARDNDPHGNHFSAESLRVLGKRIADVYLELLP